MDVCFQLLSMMARGSFNKSDAVIAYAVTFGVPSGVFWGLFFIIKSKIKKYDKLDD